MPTFNFVSGGGGGGTDSPTEHHVRFPLLGGNPSDQYQPVSSSAVNLEKSTYEDEESLKSNDCDSLGEEDDEDEEEDEEDDLIVDDSWRSELKGMGTKADKWKKWKNSKVWKWVLVVLSILLATIGSGVFFGTHSRRHSWSKMEKALEIPRFAHFGNSSRVRSHVLWGPGLTQAVQYEEAIFYVDFLDHDGRNHSLTPPLEIDEDIYVLLSGPTMLGAKVTYSGEAGRYVVSYRVLDAGVYNIRVDVFKRPEKMRPPFEYWLPLGEKEGYQTVVTKRDGTRVEGDGRKTLDMPKQICPTLEDGAEGRWVRCEDIGAPCVRWGWIYVPVNCYYEILSPAEIKAKPFWILILGTSVKRGTFFAAIDYLLGEAAKNLSTSHFWKCWGWMDLQVEKFRISYLDYRRQCYIPSLVCGSANYPDAAAEMFGKLGMDNGGPDLIVLETDQTYGKDYTGLGAIKEAFGAHWNGIAIASFSIRSPERQWEGWYPNASHILRDTLRGHPQYGFQYWDLTLPAEPWYGQMEYPLDEFTTFHWHHKCDENNMHVCSPVPDMEVQRLTSYMKRLPDRKTFIHDPQQPTIDNTTIVPGVGTKFCMQCPKYLDFSMQPNATVHCYEEIPEYLL